MLGCVPRTERGLLGVAVYPQYATNKYIYLYYTSKKTDGCANRVSRFTMTGANGGSSVGKDSCLNGLQSAASNHNGGIEFGKDGFLYVSVATPPQAGWGKICRD